MHKQGWNPGYGDLDAAKEFAASVGGGNRGGSRGGRGGGRGGAHAGVRPGAVGSYKPYEHGGNNGKKLLKELPSTYFAPTNVLNFGQFANGQNRANTQNETNVQHGGKSQNDTDSMDIDTAASVPTPTGWGNTVQPAQAPPAATPATWDAPAAATASTPTPWELINTGNHFGQASSTDPWGAVTARAQPSQSAPTQSVPASTFGNGAQAPSSKTTPPPSSGHSRAIPIVDPRGRSSSPARGMGVSFHATTPPASSGTKHVTYGPNRSPVGGIQPFVSRAGYSADPQSKNTGTAIPKIGAGATPGKASAPVSPGLGASRWNAVSTETSAGGAAHTGSANTRPVYTSAAQTGSVKSTEPVELDEQGLLKRPGWETDQGAVNDDDWPLTLNCERLITHCGAVSAGARGVGDQNASKALDEVVKICKEILRIKELEERENREVLLAEAMKVLKKAQKEAWVQWVKYWRPGPATVNKALAATGGTSAPDTQMQDAPAPDAQTQHASETQLAPKQASQPRVQASSPAADATQAQHPPQGPKFGRADQVVFDPIGFGQQPRANTDSGNAGTGGVGFGGPTQPFAGFAGQQHRPATGFGGPSQPFASLAAQQPQLATQQASQQPANQAPSVGFGSANVQQPRAAAQQAQTGQINPFGGAGSVNGEQANTVVQQAQPAQPSNSMVNMPALYPHGLPKDFDDPQAQLVFEDFFFQDKRQR